MTLTSKQEDDMLEQGRDKTELKTLKDLEFYPRPMMQFEGDTERMIKTKLRLEAIKWVKELDQAPAPDSCEVILGDNLYCECPINFIKHFFNLTEADLK